MSNDAFFFDVSDTVGAVVGRQPALSRVFERAGIDYCCGGKKTLERACQEKGLDATTLLESLRREADALSGGQAHRGVASLSLSDLADHIESTHHEYLRSELPRLSAMTQKVASVHGDRDARLALVRDTFLEMASELETHMMKEERILFPMIRECDASEGPMAFHCGSLANPIRQMEAEHDGAGSGLERLRELTDGYAPPEWACNTYRAMLDGLTRIEDDLHEHISKENNILFPRAIEMEQTKAQREP
ncbi:MAG: iron-sulfur cluster repair di-iron protein [Candidatus Eisenbacteria bacterium]